MDKPRNLAREAGAVRTNNRFGHRLLAAAAICTLLAAGVAALAAATGRLSAAQPWFSWGHHGGCGPCDGGDGPPPGEFEGTWYWLRSPDQEKRVVAGLYNRYCIRCHGVDGRGVWDIPDVPNFTNVRWQASRSDGQLARIILEGRGAVMPPFRGTLTLEEAWAMARYLRTFVPGTEASRPDLSSADRQGTVPEAAPMPRVAPPPAAK